MERNISQELLTLSEAADALRIDATTLGRRIKNGEIPSVHIGRRRLIRRQDLEEFITNHLEK